jgi:hypothetical protein
MFTSNLLRGDDLADVEAFDMQLPKIDQEREDLSSMTESDASDESTERR